MAESRCPVCNTPNPEHQDNCLVCGARLRVTTEPLPPIRAGQEPTPKSTSELERTLPGWLRDLRSEGGQQSPTPVEQPEQQPAAENPQDDLLAGLDGDLFAPSTESAAPPTEEIPSDFLTGLGSAAGEEEEETPDWLKALQGSLPADPVKSPPEAAQPAEDDTADWFAPPTHSADETGFGDNLTPETPAPAEETSEEVADWLRSLDAPTPSAPVGALSAAQPDASIPASSDTPGWLFELEGETLPFEFVEPASAPQPAAQTPDWLSAPGAEAETPTLQGFPFPTEETPAAQTPDWLSAPGAEAETPTLQGFSFPTEETPAAQTPDWLSAPGAEAETPSQPVPKPVSDDADWLASLGASATPEAETAAFDASDLPSWLSEPGAPTPSAAETPDWLVGASLESSSPETLGAAQSEESAPATRQTPTPAPAFLKNDSLPEIASSAEPFSMEMPDWLSGIAPQEAPQTRQRETEESAPTLSPGELPAWVQSMRPVESILADSNVTAEESAQEQKGPLAGLRNVLPMPASGLGIRKPPAYANKLSLDESQQSGASLLESMLAAETTASPAKVSRRVTSARLLRWLIALVLFASVAAPALLNTQFAPSNTLLPPETLATANQVNALPSGVPVLVVLDYEPALSGEMEAAAAPVIDHLMIQGAPLAFISTNPAGPLLTERLLGKFQGIHNYQPNQQYVNLGYLPGGPAGIAAFAAAPTGAIRYSVTSVPAWETEALTGVSRLSDFAAVLVITDSVDTGRAWIEQSGPALGQTPLLMTISAQVEPIIRPYYDAGQVRGLVTGLVGGAAYEQVLGKTGLGRQYWDALSASFLAAEIFIVAGSVWGLFAALRARRKKHENNEALS